MGKFFQETFEQPTSEELVNAVIIDCLNHLTKAYHFLKTSLYIAPIDEPLISARLFDEMEKLQLVDNFAYTIIPERVDYTKDIREGKVKASTARRFDLCFQNWNNKNRIIFGMEAKLLIEKNSFNRNASKLIKEYVGISGMTKYIDGIYQERGCMLGYIVDGEVATIVSFLNSEILDSLDKSQCLNKFTNKSYTHKDIFVSKHSKKFKYDLFHLMLDFRKGK